MIVPLNGRYGTVMLDNLACAQLINLDREKKNIATN